MFGKGRKDTGEGIGAATFERIWSILTNPRKTRSISGVLYWISFWQASFTALIAPMRQIRQDTTLTRGWLPTIVSCDTKIWRRCEKAHKDWAIDEAAHGPDGIGDRQPHEKANDIIKSLWITLLSTLLMFRLWSKSRTRGKRSRDWSNRTRAARNIHIIYLIKRECIAISRGLLQDGSIKQQNHIFMVISWEIASKTVRTWRKMIKVTIWTR